MGEPIPPDPPSESNYVCSDCFPGRAIPNNATVTFSGLKVCSGAPFSLPNDVPLTFIRSGGGLCTWTWSSAGMSGLYRILDNVGSQLCLYYMGSTLFFSENLYPCNTWFHNLIKCSTPDTFVGDGTGSVVL